MANSPPFRPNYELAVNFGGNSRDGLQLRTGGKNPQASRAPLEREDGGFGLLHSRPTQLAPCRPRLVHVSDDPKTSTSPTPKFYRDSHTACRRRGHPQLSYVAAWRVHHRPPYDSYGLRPSGRPSSLTLDNAVLHPRFSFHACQSLRLVFWAPAYSLLFFDHESTVQSQVQRRYQS